MSDSSVPKFGMTGKWVQTGDHPAKDVSYKGGVPYRITWKDGGFTFEKWVEDKPTADLIWYGGQVWHRCSGRYYNPQGTGSVEPDCIHTYTELVAVPKKEWDELVLSTELDEYEEEFGAHGVEVVAAWKKLSNG